MLKDRTLKRIENKLDKSNFRMGFVQAFVGFSVFFVTLGAIYSYTEIRRLTLDSLKQNAFLEVQNGANEIDNWLAKLKSKTETTANTPNVQTLDWFEIEPFFEMS